MSQSVGSIAATHKVLLPLIRRAMPTLIANSVLGGLPMTAPTGNIFGLRARYTMPSCPMIGVVLLHHVDLPAPVEYEEIVAWADEHFWQTHQSLYAYGPHETDDTWVWRWSFKTVVDATLFKMRWYEGS